MKFQGTKAELERRIDFVDIHLRDVPHGQTVHTGDGPERRLTMRETFAHILEYLDRIDPDRIVSVDLAPFEEYWRQTVPSCFPPDKRHDSEDVKRRLRKTGDYLIVLPSVSIPVLCASMTHFDVESASGVDEYCVVKTSMPPTVYRRKKVLGQKTRYRENGRIIFFHRALPHHKHTQRKTRKSTGHWASWSPFSQFRTHTNLRRAQFYSGAARR